MQSAVGVELAWQPSGGWLAQVCQLARRGGSVTVQQQAGGIRTLPDLVAALGPEPGPVALALTGRGLVLRTLPGNGGAPASAQLAALLPGANLTDFYYQYVAGSAQTLVALVRRETVQELLAEWRAAGLWVLDVYLGPLSMATVLPYLTARPEPLVAGAYQLTLAGDTLATATSLPPEELPAQTYQLGDEAVSREQLLAYAAGLGLLADAPAVGHGPELAELLHQRAEWAHRRWFLRLRLAVPVSILLLLLGNQLASQQLLARQEELAGTVGGNAQVLAQVRAVQRTVAQQQDFLRATGWTRPSVTSLCADRLAATLPAGLQLLTVDIQPAQANASEPTHGLRFRANVLTVRGQCRNAQQFNAWLQRLTGQPWIRAVRDQNFAYDYAGGLGTFTFTVLVIPTAFTPDA